jgi:hypothetical protein
MLAVPVDKLDVGVKVPDLVRPDPLRALSVPPVTTKSPAVPFQVKLEPGSSEKVNVITALSSDFKLEVSVVIETAGSKVSTEIESELPVEPMLPAESS